MNKAIEIAKLNGYEYDEGNFSLPTESIFLDPKFFQCLGKGLGWNPIPTSLMGSDNRDYSEWEYQWHRFIDALAEVKSAEDFFKGVINKTS